jgi:Icc-related predicted phosphoesterase
MKLRIYSDIHQNHIIYHFDRNPDYLWYPTEMEDDHETTLAILGDIWESDKFLKFAGVSWLKNLASRFKYILIVLGNHDYYGASIGPLEDKINRFIQDEGLINCHLLNDRVVELDGIPFFGSCFWTSIDFKNQHVVHDPETEKMTSRFRSIRVGKSYQRFTIDRWIEQHIKAKTELKRALEQHDDLVVLTHMAPSRRSLSPDEKDSILSPFYFEDMTEILKTSSIRMWAHGHTHYAVYYEEHGIPIYSNPVGYPGEDTGYEDLVIEL